VLRRSLGMAAPADLEEPPMAVIGDSRWGARASPYPVSPHVGGRRIRTSRHKSSWFQRRDQGMVNATVSASSGRPFA